MGRDNKAININKSSREELLTLPQLTEHEADRVIAQHPSIMRVTWSLAGLFPNLNMTRFATT